MERMLNYGKYKMKLKKLYKILNKKYPDDNINLVHDRKYSVIYINNIPVVKELRK